MLFGFNMPMQNPHERAAHAVLSKLPIKNLGTAYAIGILLFF